MSTDIPTLAGRPCWADLMTGDLERAKAFYGAVFGWTFEDGGEQFGHYHQAFVDGKPVAGVGPKMTPDGEGGVTVPDMPDIWTVYLHTDDAQAAHDAITRAGGGLMVEPMAVGDLGTMAIAVDPGKAVVGLWQPDTFAGFQAWSAPGAPAWFELTTRDYDAVLPFYRTAFGWETSVMSAGPEFRYTTLGEGERACAGVFDGNGHVPDEMPAHWGVYFGVSDTDQALQRVTAAGGSITQPAWDTEYGRMAAVADDQGAHFRIVAV